MTTEYLKFRIVGKKPKYEKAPLEDEFAAWLRKRIPMKYKQEPAERTIENHILTLRSCIARTGIATFLTTFESDHNRRRRTTQRYYKEFLCEHFSHIILPLLQDEEREIRKEKE